LHLAPAELARLLQPKPTAWVEPLQPRWLVGRAGCHRNDGAGATTKREVDLTLLAFNIVTEMRVSEDPEFEDPDLGDVELRTFEASIEFTLSAGDGPKTVYAQFRDDFGQLSELFEASIVLDTAPPEDGSVVINQGAAFTTTAAPPSPCQAKVSGDAAASSSA